MAGNSGESYRLTSPDGASTYDLAPWVRFNDGPDFGDSWMTARYAEHPAADGGQFAYESAGVRTTSFALLGDVPGLARVIIIPTDAASLYPGGSWYSDSLSWAFAGASFPGFWSGGSLGVIGGGISTTVGDKFAVGSQALQHNASQNATW